MISLFIYKKKNLDQPDLTTMLRARGETFENSPELQQIGLVLNSLLGRLDNIFRIHKNIIDILIC